uniref:uncharacterized protein LOC128931897 n=1 Tax=Callithrix jacchus TaxID=9483 RepID=UPI0023DD3DAB|nr:uncharacterized protein LOC128931897 [Callithrix jacchus]
MHQINTQALASFLLLLALLQQRARPPSVAKEIILALRHVMPSPPLSSLPQPPKTRRGPSPGLLLPAKPGRLREAALVGVCERLQTRCPGRNVSSPGRARLLSSAVPAPAAVAAEASTRPPPPLLPAPRRLSSAPSCVPIPAPTSAVVPPTSQVTAADKPGRALPERPAAPSQLLTHTAPRGRELKGEGAPHASIPGKSEGRRRRRRGGEADTHPVSRPPPAPGRPYAAGSALRTHWERAPGTPVRRLRGAPWAAGALARPGKWASRVLLSEGQGKGVVARCLAKPSPFSPTLSLTRPPAKGDRGSDEQGDF